MKQLDLEQVEQLKQIGEHLATERQQRSILLEEVALKTYIPLRILQALEAGEIERLPEPVFVQGFIRRYADTLGLDGAALAKTFNPIPAPIAEVPVNSEPVSSNTFDRTAFLEELQHLPDRVRPYWRGVAIGAVVLVGGIAAASFLNRPSSTPEKPAIVSNQASSDRPAEKTNLPAKPEATAISSPKATSSPASKPPAQAATSTNSSPQTVPSPDTNAPVQVAVNLTDESWLQVEVDGKTEFEGILKKGDQKTWTAKKQLVLQSGNAGAVKISYNNGEAKALGALGEVKDITFPPTQQSQVAN